MVVLYVTTDGNGADARARISVPMMAVGRVGGREIW